ncbi:hypothetical protein [Mycobacteroides salmoniphilum]|uniref:Uncharacterized protein n=1 Tax=Mycobacteroides salmoniphilum TaxID=404941 RepID=A0A4R8SZN0_9MYCO|nr:hypothetical protein [Mycobacteroides salmoniphilum]TEA09077.1 hypothetical protein CCUG60884_00245 [Mycobacteroides salmoniphilum]
MIVAAGMGWPNLDEDEIVKVMACGVVIIGLLWLAGYIIWDIIQSELYNARAHRKEKAQAEQAEREAIRADREWRQQLRAEGWPPGIEELPAEQIREIVQQATAVHHKVAAALTHSQQPLYSLI